MPQPIQALLFDTFGTTVDWLGSLTAYAQQLGKQNGVDADWAGLVKDWRAHYKPAIQPVREGKRPWADFDTLHREELDKIAKRYGAGALTRQDRDLLTHGWHYLHPWPDVVPALHRLKKKFLIGPLSNGSTRQLVDLAKFGGLPWDVVFGADLFRTYKPDAKLYRGACAYLGLSPDRVLMVAAHNNDLEHAKKNGMQTCFVHRHTEDAEPAGSYDFVVNDFEHLARTLGAV